MSDQIVKLSTAAHWYTKEAQPLHTVIGKNGKERNTTLRDARKLGLLPSVTTILKTLAAPQLTRWLVENAIVAALTATQQEGEDLQEFAVRVARESGDVASQAADFGTRFHAMMEDLLNGYTQVVVADDLVPYIPFAKKWIEENVAEVISAEQCVVGEGFAGTADLFCVTPEGDKVLFDFKTKQLKRKDDGSWQKPQAYDNWTYQLAAYGSVLGADRVANVVVNSREPGDFITIFHSPDKREKGWKVFQMVRS